jgi:hypothetical protein
MPVIIVQHREWFDKRNGTTYSTAAWTIVAARTHSTEPGLAVARGVTPVTYTPGGGLHWAQTIAAEMIQAHAYSTVGHWIIDTVEVTRRRDLHSQGK